MRSLRPLFGLSSVLVVAAVAAACGGSKARSTTSGEGSTGLASSGNGGGNASTGTTGSESNGGGVSFGDGGTDPVVSLTITPAGSTIEVLNDAVPPPTMFTATGTTQHGAQVAVTGEWSFDQLSVATMNPSTGALTATGLVGGIGTVTFKYGALSVTAKATVKLHYTSDPQMVPASTKTMFGQASTPDPSLALVYPYNNTVFPRGLAGPVIQWNGGGVNDIYYVHAVSPTFEFEAWGTVPPPSQYTLPTMPDDIWKKLTDSTTGAVTVSIQRNDGSQPYTPITETWNIAAANLTGTIYYWEVNSGAVVRLAPGDTSPQSFLTEPTGVTCIACHSVSKDGSTIVGAFNGSASPWGTFDSSGNSLYVSGTDPNNGPNGSGFQAITPDGSEVLFGQERQLPYLILSSKTDQTPLAQLNPGTGFPVYPAWSGDGKTVAFGVRQDGDWLDFNTSALWTASIDIPTNTFSNVQQIIANTPTRTAVIYPTFSPDSKWIAFERSTQARSRGGLGDVWLSGVDGSNAISLDQANGLGILTGPEVSSTYEPTMMPVAAGGYFWLVIVSERTYGNTLTVTDPTTRVKQLWVTAIDANPMPGVDPSHPAFWLPGQDTTNNNMRGEWSLSPCKMIGQSCSAGYDCCAGFCTNDGMGNLTCSNTSSGCSMLGDKCTTASDCCDSTALCTGGFCATPTPQ